MDINRGEMFKHLLVQDFILQKKIEIKIISDIRELLFIKYEYSI